MTPRDRCLQLGRNALEMSLDPGRAGAALRPRRRSRRSRVFQALTQIHEMTLTFIPKIGATILALALFGPWMLQKLLNYTIALFESVPGLVR